MRDWWVAIKVGKWLAYWYPFAMAWGYEQVTEDYYGVMIGKGGTP